MHIDEVKGDATPSFEVEIQISAPTHLARGMTVKAARIMKTNLLFQLTMAVWMKRKILYTGRSSTVASEVALMRARIE